MRRHPFCCHLAVFVTGVGLTTAAGFCCRLVAASAVFPLILVAVSLPERKLTAHLGRGIERLLGGAPFQSACLILLGFITLLGWSRLQDDSLLVWDGRQDELLLSSSPVVRRAPVKGATDRGSEVQLLIPIPEEDCLVTTSVEDRYYGCYGVGSRMLRVSSPDTSCNCHGWVFARGRYWLTDNQVEMILKENGYGPVNAPGAGDLIVYFGPTGRILHTGIVRLAPETGQGPVLIESKWGKNGRFLHASEDQIYSATFRYFHTPRGSHTLHIPGNYPGNPHSLLQ
jgi:hypothetical protein